jgi:hypothetical protein
MPSPIAGRDVLDDPYETLRPSSDDDKESVVRTLASNKDLLLLLRGRQMAAVVGGPWNDGRTSARTRPKRCHDDQDAVAIMGFGSLLPSASASGDWWLMYWSNSTLRPNGSIEDRAPWPAARHSFASTMAGSFEFGRQQQHGVLVRSIVDRLINQESRAV